MKQTEFFNRPVPRYTSYPTALDWQSPFDDGHFERALVTTTSEAFNAYLHIPFCHRRCLYCGCNVILSRKNALADAYLKDMKLEMHHKLGFLKLRPRLKTLHFGGGSPNFLTATHWSELVDFLAQKFTLGSDLEFSVELDPMGVSKDYLTHLRKLGVNRVSFGIQDVNAQTLAAVEREYDLIHLNKVLSHAQTLNFDSINYDFIYGLPYQNEASFKANLQWIRMYKPGRIALFSYAHIPHMKRHQKRIPFKALPDAPQKLALGEQARRFLLAESYVQIGLDHFALPGDSLARAQQEGTLSRNFMGYTAWGELDILAFGSSAISNVGDVYAQNHTRLKAYRAACNQQANWFEKGMHLSLEDRRRAAIIASLMNHGFLDIEEFSLNWQLNFEKEYQSEIEKLAPFIEHDYVRLEEGLIKVTPAGRKFVRHLASTFDAYRTEAKGKQFSSGI